MEQSITTYCAWLSRKFVDSTEGVHLERAHFTADGIRAIIKYEGQDYVMEISHIRKPETTERDNDPRQTRCHSCGAEFETKVSGCSVCHTSFCD